MTSDVYVIRKSYNPLICKDTHGKMEEESRSLSEVTWGFNSGTPSNPLRIIKGLLYAFRFHGRIMILTFSPIKHLNIILLSFSLEALPINLR